MINKFSLTEASQKHTELDRQCVVRWTMHKQTIKRMANDHHRTIKSSRHELAPSFLLKYPFLITLIIHYLDDKDVLTALLLVNRAIRVDLRGYCLKRFIDQRDLRQVANIKRYLPVKVSGVRSVKSLPIAFPSGCDQSMMKKIEFAWKFDKPITPRFMLPATVTHLRFRGEFNQLIPVGFLPNSIIHLEFGYYFDQHLDIGSIPSSVTHLKFGYRFNQALVVGVIPPSVTHLHFGGGYERLIPVGVIPSTVTHLTFDDLLNQHNIVEAIPSSATNLTFGDCFNRPLVIGTIPESITHLRFGLNFKQPIPDGVIPHSVSDLTLDHDIKWDLSHQPDPMMWWRSRTMQAR